MMWNNFLYLVQRYKLPDDQRIQIEIEGCVACFESRKEHGLLFVVYKPADYVCAIYYDRLISMRLIDFDGKRRQAVYQKAKAEYSEFINRALNSEDADFGPEQLKMINELPEKQNRPFANLCKRIALLEYFNDLLELGEELQDKITELNQTTQ